MKSCIYNPDNKSYHVTLVDRRDSHKNKMAQISFKNRCKTNGIPIERETRYSSDMYIYRISVDSLDKMKSVQELKEVLSIEEAVPIYELNQLGG